MWVSDVLTDVFEFYLHKQTHTHTKQIHTYSLLTITLHSSVITTLITSNKKFPFHDVITEFDCVL